MYLHADRTQHTAAALSVGVFERNNGNILTAFQFIQRTR